MKRIERPDGRGRRALVGEAEGAALVHADPGDVEVHPGDPRRVGVVGGAADEVAQEESREQRPAGRVADLGVREVGDRRVEVVDHVGGQRQLPGELADVARRREELGDRLVVAHDARRAGAEGDRDGSGEGRDVDDDVGMLATGGDEAVREDQPALGIRVEHFDGRAAEHPQHVAGPDRTAGGHVVGDAQPRRHLHGQRRRSATARSTASAVAAPHMSYFMPTIDAAGLSDRPPVSKVMPLPTSATCRVAPAGE